MAERVYLDCSSLPNQLRLNTDNLPHSIQIDGYEFLQRLEAIKDSFAENLNNKKPKFLTLSDRKRTTIRVELIEMFSVDVVSRENILKIIVESQQHLFFYDSITELNLDIKNIETF